MDETGQSPPAIGGEMGVRVRAFDWSATPLGPRAGWPASLHTAASLILASPIPSLLLWGKALTIAAYNDAYLPHLVSKPEALGRTHAEVWAEAREVIAPQLAAALAGKTVSVERARFILLRHGAPEEAWFDYAFTPVCDETGRIAGVLNTGIDITARVWAEAARAESETRLRVALEAGELGDFDWNLRAGTVQPSRRARRIFGFAAGEGHDPEDYFCRVVPEERERVRAEATGGLHTGRIDSPYPAARRRDPLRPQLQPRAARGGRRAGAHDRHLPRRHRARAG
jgi:PAS domain-containing protein